MYCDNQSVVAIVNTGTSKCPLVMSLVRALFFIVVHFNFDIRLDHVPGVHNTVADLLSRGNFIRFRELFGAAYAGAPTMSSHDFIV
jgi:hypothetical protein